MTKVYLKLVLSLSVDQEEEVGGKEYSTKLIDERLQLEECHMQNEAVNMEILVSFNLTHLII